MSVAASAPKRLRTDTADMVSFDFFAIYVHTLTRHGYGLEQRHFDAYYNAKKRWNLMTTEQHALFRRAAAEDRQRGDGYSGPVFTTTMAEQIDGYDDVELTVSWFMEAAFKDSLKLTV